MEEGMMGGKGKPRGAEAARFVAVALFAALFLPGIAHSQVNSVPSQPHLLVKGEAVRTVEPDRFTIVVQLQAVDPSAEAARRKVAADAARVLAAYQTHGALEGGIEASGLSMQADFSYEQTRQVFKGTRVQRSMSATFDHLDAVRACLAELQTSDGLRISGITTAFSGEAELRAQLKREAAGQTRESARQLAEAYGARITGLYTISDVAPQFAYGVQAGSWPRKQALSASPPPPPAPQPDVGARVDAMEAGDIVLTENVYAIFLISQ